MLGDSWVLGSCIICKDNLCKANSIFIKKHPKITDRAFSDAFDKQMCMLINKERSKKHLPPLSCDHTSCSLAWNRVNKMIEEKGIIDDGAKKRLEEYKHTGRKAD
jgi:uncharacterized protein YkwD